MIVLSEIVVPPDSLYNAKYPPLALASLASALKQAGHSCQMVLCEPANTPEQWCSEILARDPDVVAFSVFIGYKLKMALVLSRMIKQKRPDLPILWGGVLPSTMPEQVLGLPFVDWVCVGPGETTVVSLAGALAAKSGLSSIPGLGWRDSGRIVLNPPSLPRLDPNPARPDWHSFPVDKFLFDDGYGNTIVGMIASRGCPHDCGFCYNSGFHGRRWQPAPVELVKAEMMELRDKYGVTGFTFLDDLFFGNKPRGMELLDWMAENNLHVFSLDLRLDQVERELLDCLRAAKTRHVLFGVESTDDRLLELINKRSRKSHFLQAIRMFDDYPEIALWLSFIVGFPTETFDEMKHTIRDLAIAGRRPNTIVNLNAFLPLPCTKLFDLAVQHGFVPPKDLEGWTELVLGCGGGLDHFPGRLTPAQTLYLRRAASYLRMVHRPGLAGSGLSGAARSVFAQIADWRLAHERLDLPADLWVYHRLQEWRQSIRASKT